MSAVERKPKKGSRRLDAGFDPDLGLARQVRERILELPICSDALGGTVSINPKRAW
jgi:hypothetical protein